MNTLGFDKAPDATRVVVAMSGGVDSSVTAALLKEQGYETIGITLQLYDHGQAVGRPGTCCAGADIHDARRVASALDIPHYVLDYESRFRDAVMDDFADSYLAGETPIPCVRCNQTVKFTDLMQTARDLGADALATGHYVRWIGGADGPELHRGAETARDQSYFLFATTPDQLDLLRFPLGAMTKDEVRDHARRLDLAVSDKPDSQDICFVPQGRYADVVAKLRPGAIEPGEIVDLDGKVLGSHEGVINFTVGQRKGIGIAAADPLFVVRLEPESRRVVIGPRSALMKTTMTIRDVNWLGVSSMPREGVPCEVKLRSAQPQHGAHVTPLPDGRARVVLDEAAEAVAPGQACVMYVGDRVLGGGWIERADAVAAAVAA
ncbi:MAG: tRNA 2-thiouridine(34) synthase MnmA [Rhodospirillaceae bacterium]|nr:tRNA 2-thiouridine(34) synthase MnmA [Rhodospirillaceae bacterium]MBT7648271.1 tRNA 2-thiouridine(34) synthase MnmA [Rhodospirillaceae bacterium]